MNSKESIWRCLVCCLLKAYKRKGPGQQSYPPLVFHGLRVAPLWSVGPKVFEAPHACPMWGCPPPILIQNSETVFTQIDQASSLKDTNMPKMNKNERSGMRFHTGLYNIVKPYSHKLIKPFH